MIEQTVTPEDDKMLSQQQLAKRWGLTTRTLTNWRSSGKGPAFLSIGHRIKYSLSEIVRYENEDTRKNQKLDNRFPAGAQEKGEAVRMNKPQ